MKAASPAEVAAAREALALITARGYHRGRELQSLLNALLE
jgi:hypothetical protein